MLDLILCPVCKAPLSKVHYKNLEVDICLECKGVWFDKGELTEFLLEFWDKDSGISQKFFEDRAQNVEKIKSCPRCNVPMDIDSWRYIQHIAILDICPKCQGIWADKGEIFLLAFKDPKSPQEMKELARNIYEGLDWRMQWESVEKFGNTLTERATIADIFAAKILPIKDDNKAGLVHWINYSIIIICSLIFIYLLFFVKIKDDFLNLFALIPVKLFSGTGYFGLFSHIFLHRTPTHLIFNMYFLWIFGDNIEDRLGHLHYVLFFLVSGILAGLVWPLLHLRSYVPSYGASGAIAAVMGAYFCLYPKAKIETWVFKRSISLPAWLYLGFWFVFQFIFSYLSIVGGAESGVNYLAHLTGFILGFLWIKLLVNRQKREIK